MSSTKSSPRNPAVYRSRDPIANFRLRVRLQRVTSSSLFLEMARQEGDDVELKQMRQLETHAVPETRVFRWQEKVFSRSGVEKYSKPPTPSSTDTPLDAEYRNLVRQTREDGKLESISASPCLFSYVENDEALHLCESEGVLTTSPPSSSESESVAIRRRRARYFSPGAGIAGKSKRDAHVWRSMKIMADLSDDTTKVTESPDTEEDPLFPHFIVLCTIHYNSNGTLIVDPDFNPPKSSRPYSIDTEIGSDSWEFSLENASAEMTREEAGQEIKILRRLQERDAKGRAALVGTEFDVPPAQSLRVACRGEIVSAWDFEYDGLYVVWCLIPGRWWWGATVEDSGETRTDSILTGLTHCCTAGTSGASMFGECFELDLLYRNLGTKSESNGIDLRPNPLKTSELPFEIREWPQLLIQVMSRDSWYRTRTEGYGVTPLPSQPGAHTLDVGCWRPVGGPVDELRRYFIGGSPELSDPFFVAKPPVDDDGGNVRHLNLFGLRTMTTGTVRLRLNLAFQSQSLVNASMDLRLKSGAPSASLVGPAARVRGQEPLGGMFHLVSIVQAFQQARKRMVEAREALLNDLKSE